MYKSFPVCYDRLSFFSWKECIFVVSLLSICDYLYKDKFEEFDVLYINVADISHANLIRKAAYIVNTASIHNG